VSVESEVFSRLSGYAGLTSILGGLDPHGHVKIYPLVIEQDTVLPAITYFKVSDVPEHAMGADASIKTVRIQVSCWAEIYGVVKSLEVQVKAALSRYRGGNILDCFWDNSTDLSDLEEDVFHVANDFIVFYSG